MHATLKNNAAAGYRGPLKIELLKDAGLLHTVNKFDLVQNLSIWQII